MRTVLASAVVAAITAFGFGLTPSPGVVAGGSTRMATGAIGSFWDGVPPLICPAGDRCARPNEGPPVCLMGAEDLLGYLEEETVCDHDAWNIENAGPGIQSVSSGGR